jgi:isoleucyl-tRNA synthetase
VLALRAEVNKLLEDARQRKEIGSSSDAAAQVPDVGVPAEVLREALNVSQVELGAAQAIVGPATGEKCQRCWLILPTVGADRHHAELCTRCVEVVGSLAGSAGFQPAP